MSTGALYMDAVITPNRSLSQRGLAAVVIVTAALGLIPFVMSLVMGAPFPPMFLGLDVLGLWFALHWSTKGARQRRERVQVSSEAVRVLRGFGHREWPVWTSPTAFTRVDVEGEDDELRVWLRLSAQSLPVATALGPAERGAFAEALKEALRNARLERHPL